MAPEIAAILSDIGRWLGSRPDLHGLALVGSYASVKAGADSDIDLVLPADAVAAYHDGNCVQDALGGGRAIAGTSDEWFGNVWSLFVRLADGPEVEFTFAERSWTNRAWRCATTNTLVGCDPFMPSAQRVHPLSGVAMLQSSIEHRSQTRRG
jgi:hypothetical protein